MSIESKKFDLHCHTFHSDGVNSPQEMLERANELGLDYLAITDHNTVDGVIELIESGILADSDTILIPGVELSLFWGHFVILGVDPYEYKHQMENVWGLAKGSYLTPALQSTIEGYLEWSLKHHHTFNIVAHPCLPPYIMSVPPSTLEDLYKRGLVQGAENHNHDIQRLYGIINLYNGYQQNIESILNNLKIPKFANSDAHYKEYLGINLEKQNGDGQIFLDWVEKSQKNTEQTQ